MNKKCDQDTSRREFLRGGLRTAMFGGLLSLGVGLGHRRFNSAKSTQLCNMAYCCAQCNQLSTCDLPEAITARNSKDIVFSQEKINGATDGKR